MLTLVLFLTFVDIAFAFPKLPGSNLLPWKRNVFEERQAEAQPMCSCEPVDPSAAAFVRHAPFAAAASAAPTPEDYVNVFTNENDYCSAEGGLGFTTLDTYDSELCANLCDSVEGCAAFTLYYEKDGGNYRGTDIESSASIKCAFWAGSVSPNDSIGRGPEAYNAIIAGSNGYTSKIITPRGDFGSAGYLGEAAIDCPKGSAEADSFIGSKNVGTGAFDAELCVDFCRSVGCKFFNTYVLNRNGESVGQYCDMYSAPIPASYANNVGRSDGKYNYTITSSYTFGHGPFNYGETDNVSSVPGAEPSSVSLSGHSDPHQTGTTDLSTSSGWSEPQSSHGGPQGAVLSTTILSASSTSSSYHDPSKVNSATSSQSLASTAVPSSDASAKGGHGGNSSWTLDQSTVVIVTTQTVIPLSIVPSTPGSTSGTYTHSQTLSSTSSLSDSSRMTNDPSQTPGDPTHSSTTSTFPLTSPTHSLSSTSTYPSLSTSSTGPGIDSIDPSTVAGQTSSSSPQTPTTSTSPISDSDPVSPLSSASATPSSSPQDPTTATSPTSDIGPAYLSSSTSPSSGIDPVYPSSSTSLSLGTDPAYPSSSSSSTSAVDPVYPSSSTSSTSHSSGRYPSTSKSPIASSSAYPASTWTSSISSIDPVDHTASTSLIPSSSLQRSSTTSIGTYTHSVTTSSKSIIAEGHTEPYGSPLPTSMISSSRPYVAMSASSWSTPLSSSFQETTSSSTTSVSSTIPVVADPTETAVPVSPIETSTPLTNSTGFPSGYNTSIPFNMTHMTWNTSNQSWYCNLTGLWYPLSGNFSLPGFNSTNLYANTSVPTNTTVSSILPTVTSTPLSVAADPTSTSVNSTAPSNSTGYPVGYNTSMPFNMTHMIYSLSNNSWYCELTHQWYPANGNLSLPGFNFTMPSYNATSYAANATTSSVYPDPTTTQVSSTSSSTAVDPSLTVSNSTGTTYPSYNSTGTWNMTNFNSSHLVYSAPNNSVFCRITGLWYAAGNFSLASLNLTGNYTVDPSYSLNYTVPSNTTNSSSTSVLPSSTSISAEVPSSTPAPDNSTMPLNNTWVTYPTYNYSIPFNASHMIYSPSNNSFYCELTHLWYPAGNLSNNRGFNVSSYLIFNGTLPSYNYTLPSNTTVNATSTSVTSSTSEVPTATPSPDNSTTKTNGTSGYNSTGIFFPLFNASASNSSHLHFAANGSVYCDITQQWYLPNDTSWMALLNSTYPSFNVSAYGAYNSSNYGLNSTFTNTTDVNATLTSSSSSMLGPSTPTSTPDPSNNATSENFTGIYPQYNSTLPSFNASALNSTGHLIYYANGSVFCDYTQKLYAPNDTLWMSLLNHTSSGYNVSAYASFNSTAYTLNSTMTNTTSTNSNSVESTAKPTPEPVADATDPSTNSTAVVNSTGIFPQYNTTLPSFNASMVNSTDHLIFYANGSVWCDYTQELYPANDTSWMSLLNATSSGFNASAYSGFNSTGYNATSYSYNAASLNSTTPDTNATSTDVTTPADSSDTPTPTPTLVVNSTDLSSNTTIPANNTGAFPSYNGTLSSSYNSSVLNSTDHLIFYANGSVFCDYTQQLYPANDTSWMNTTYSFMNSTSSSYNTIGGFNATSYSYRYNATTLNSTTPIDNSTPAEPSPTSSTPSDSDIPAPLDNSTIPSNATAFNNTGVFPNYYLNSNTSATIINSTAHLIFFSNGSVYCEDTQQLYPANDTSWTSLNATSAYAMLNATGAGYAPSNLTSTATDSDYTDVSPNATGGDVPTRTPTPTTALPAQSASPTTAYIAPTYSNGTTVDGNSTAATDGYEGAVTVEKVRRWMAPRERR